MKSLTDYDLMSPAVQACPWEFYARLQQEAPLYRMPGQGFWLVTSFELAREVIRQPDLFASGVSPMALRPGGIPQAIIDVYVKEGWLPRASCSTSDPPAHTQVRSFLEPLFTVARVREIRPLIERTVKELLDAWPASGEVEFVHDFAHPLPMVVIAELIGVAHDDLARFKAWSDAIVEPFSMMVSPEREVECARLVVEMQHFFRRELEDRERSPRDDLLTAVARAAAPDQQGFDLEQQLTILAIDLLASGNETTTAGIASGLKLLVEQPAVVAQLRAERKRLENFVEEVLRLESPAQGMFRRVTRDTVLGGQPLREGELLSLRFGAANRDPEQFPEPERIDLHRQPAGKHLAFGIGRHHCIGAQLARQEMLSAFEALLDRYSSFELTPGKPAPEYAPSFFGRNLLHLHLTCRK
jgi:cytochrome P450